MSEPVIIAVIAAITSITCALIDAVTQVIIAIKQGKLILAGTRPGGVWQGFVQI